MPGPDVVSVSVSGEAGFGGGGLSADRGDHLGGNDPEFDVAVLGGGAQHLERLVGGAPVLAHDDPEGLVDDRAGGHAVCRCSDIAVRSAIRTANANAREASSANRPATSCSGGPNVRGWVA